MEKLLATLGTNYESRESARIGLFSPVKTFASIRVIRSQNKTPSRTKTGNKNHKSTRIAVCVDSWF